MATKKFYWLKLKNTFFNQKEIKLLRRIAGGDTYTVIYLKLMLLSLENEGTVFFDNVTDKFEEELALELDEDVENVQVTISFLKAKGLLEIKDEDEYFLNEVPTMIGKESESASRVRKHRKNKKEVISIESNTEKLQSNKRTLQGNDGVTPSNTEIEIDKELEKDKEIELYKEIESYINKKEKNEDDNDYSNSPAYFFENNGFGTISPHIRDQMNGIYDDFLSIGAKEDEINQLIIKALKKSLEYNARTWAYAEKILFSWHNKGYKTISEVDAAEKQYQAKKNNYYDASIPEEKSHEALEVERRTKELLDATIIPDDMEFI